MSVVFTLEGIQAVNSARDGLLPLTGNRLQLTKFKTTTGTEEPTDLDTAASFEADGVVTYTGTAATGQITNKVILNSNTFQLDLIVPPEEPIAGGSFNINKVGLYIQDPENPLQSILLASLKFNNTFVKEAPSMQSAGNSLVLTLSLIIDSASDVIEVQDASSRDFNLIPVLDSVDALQRPHVALNRMYRILQNSPVASTGKTTFLVHSCKTSSSTATEWIPDNHSLLFPINSLPAMTNGVPSDNKTHSSTTLRFLYYHSDLTNAENHVINRFPANPNTLLVSFFVDNPSQQGSTEGVGGKMRGIQSVAQNLYYDDPVNGPTNNGGGQELISITLSTPISPLPALNQLVKIWVANTSGVSGGGGGGGSLSDGGTPFPTPNTVMRRGAAGTAEVATPTQSGDITNKSYVDAQVLAVSNSLQSHLTSESAHAATMSITATPHKVVKRDANGNSEIATPQTDNHIANKSYVDAQSTVVYNAVVAQVDSIISTAMTTFLNAHLSEWLDPRFESHDEDNAAHALLFDSLATPNKAIKRTAQGTAQITTAASPSAQDIANVGYVDTKLEDLVNSEDNPLIRAATSTATPFKLAVRDDKGCSSFANPEAATHAVNLQYLESLLTDRALPDKIILRNNVGQASVADPEAPTHIVTLRYLEANAPVRNPSGTPKNGDIKIDDATGVTRVYIYGNGSWRQVFPAQFM